MIRRIASFIQQHHLLASDDLHLVALSGGADSVALLLVLLDLGYRVEAVHCNFHLRGAESDRDEEFVKQLCAQKDIELHLIHFDTKEYAALHKVSIEMAARELRYRYFDRLRKDIGATTVCVAHHQDDAVETLLMNLMKGAGLRGLTGIRPVNGSVVRPLLCVNREEIERYLQAKRQAYVVDSTNLQPDVLRNKIRLQLIPLMEQILPNSSRNISKTSLFVSEAEKVFDNSMKSQIFSAVKVGKDNRSQSVMISALRELPSAESFLHEWLQPYGFNSAQESQILTHSIGDSGKVFYSPTHALLIDRNQLILEPIQPALKTLKIPETGSYAYTDDIHLKIELENAVIISKSDTCITIDAEKVQMPLTLRPVVSGDRFSPLGMKGQKLVSDFMTDLKLNLFEKHRQLVLADATDRIVWLVGRRIDNSVKITPQSKAVYRIAIC